MVALRPNPRLQINSQLSPRKMKHNIKSKSPLKKCIATRGIKHMTWEFIKEPVHVIKSPHIISAPEMSPVTPTQSSLNRTNVKPGLVHIPNYVHVHQAQYVPIPNPGDFSELMNTLIMVLEETRVKQEEMLSVLQKFTTSPVHQAFPISSEPTCPIKHHTFNKPNLHKYNVMQTTNEVAPSFVYDHNVIQEKIDTKLTSPDSLAKSKTKAKPVNGHVHRTIHHETPYLVAVSSEVHELEDEFPVFDYVEACGDQTINRKVPKLYTNKTPYLPKQLQDMAYDYALPVATSDDNKVQDVASYKRKKLYRKAFHNFKVHTKRSKRDKLAIKFYAFHMLKKFMMISRQNLLMKAAFQQLKINRQVLDTNHQVMRMLLLNVSKLRPQNSKTVMVQAYRPSIWNLWKQSNMSLSIDLLFVITICILAWVFPLI